MRSGAFVRVYDSRDWTVTGCARRRRWWSRRAGRRSDGPARRPGRRVAAVGHDTVAVAVARPGVYVVKFTWTPYWRLVAMPGPVGTVAGSLARAPGDWTLLRAGRAGRYLLRVQPSWRTALAQIF